MSRRLGRLIAIVAVVLMVSWVATGCRMSPVSAGQPGAAESPRAQGTAGERRQPVPSGADAIDPETGLAWVSPHALPAEARTVIVSIERGGPFRYRSDGQRFENREGLLPRRPRGYYREYTVPTPGEADRGARRLVTGDGDRQFFYTADHYDSFQRVRR